MQKRGKFEDHIEVLLKPLQDGKPLEDKAGPYRIVIPEEKRMARWARQVTKLKIVDVHL